MAEKEREVELKKGRKEKVINVEEEKQKRNNECEYTQ